MSAYSFSGETAAQTPGLAMPRLDVIHESLGHEFTYWANSKPVMRDGAVTKPPINPRTGSYARMNDPATLSGFDLAARNIQDGKCPWISAALIEPNGIVMLDVDHALETLKKHPEVGRALARYRRNGGYVEQSQSRNGLHAFVRAKLEGNIKGGKLEAYVSNRHFVVTGWGAEGGKVIEDQSLVDTFIDVISRHKGQKAGKSQEPDETEVGQDATGDKLTDDLLDEAAEEVRQAIGPHIFDAGDWDGATLPPDDGDLATLTAGIIRDTYPSQSEADQALCGFAARVLYRLGVTEREELKSGVRAIMERSALSHRDKWRDRADYRERTIKKAVADVLGAQADKTQTSDGAEQETGTDSDKVANPKPDLIRRDILASEYFIKDHAERLRYCPQRGSYLGWNGCYWEWASQDDAIELGKKTAGRLFDMAKAVMQQGDADKKSRTMPATASRPWSSWVTTPSRSPPTTSPSPTWSAGSSPKRTPAAACASTATTSSSSWRTRTASRR